MYFIVTAIAGWMPAYFIVNITQIRAQCKYIPLVAITDIINIIKGSINIIAAASVIAAGLAVGVAAYRSR